MKCEYAHFYLKINAISMIHRAVGRLETGREEPAACQVIALGLDRAQEHLVTVSTLEYQ